MYKIKVYLSKVRLILGLILMVVGTLGFLTAGQSGTSDYDVTQRLEEPQFLGGGATILAENGRLYVFNEEMCSVNVFTQEGDFLFCVRGSRFQNGKATMFMRGGNIYIEGRDHTLYLFDSEGNYVGQTKIDQDLREYVVLSDWEAPVYPPGELVLFDSNHVWYYVDKTAKNRRLLYCRDFRKKTEQLIGEYIIGETVGLEDCVYGKSGVPARVGDTEYRVAWNRLLRVQNGETQVLAQTPLYLNYRHSALATWLTMVAGCLLSGAWSKF